MKNSKIRNFLNLIFIILAVLTVVFYFAFKEQPHLYIYTAMAAFFFKIVEFFLRFSGR